MDLDSLVLRQSSEAATPGTSPAPWHITPDGSADALCGKIADYGQTPITPDWETRSDICSTCRDALREALADVVVDDE
ncbi:hypothetical protein ABIA33_005824 [Streptacidiphilus sp. MAP12-16]